MQQNCHCGSKKLFSECCEPFIQGKTIPETAEQLMRSRYSAYATISTKYLMQTTHRSTRKNHNEKDIKAWASTNKWLKLEVIKTEMGQATDNAGIVEFKAVYMDKKHGLQVHHEKSTFLKEDGRWFYVDGTY